MAMKANASAQGASFKNYVGVGSFRVINVNPTKAEMEEFFGRSFDKEPEYLKGMVDTQDNNKPYKQLRVTYLIQADIPEDINPKNTISRETNAALTEPLKTSVSFFIDSRYFYNKDKSKVQVIDKYGRTAWVTIDQCKNHQIPVYANGPAKLDADYRPTYRGEEELLKFVTDYLNITPIETYNSNTGQWMTNSHPEDCEQGLYEIKNYFTGDISELKKHCGYMPDNRLKLLVGVRTDDQGRQFGTVYTRMTLRNGAKSYTRLKDSLEGNAQYLNGAVFSDASDGSITNIHEYKENVKETNLNAPADDPFAKANALPEDDLPFGGSNDEDPFANN